MDQDHGRTRTAKKGERGGDHAQQRAQQMRLSEQRTRKAAARTPPEIEKMYGRTYRSRGGTGY